MMTKNPFRYTGDPLDRGAMGRESSVWQRRVAPRCSLSSETPRYNRSFSSGIRTSAHRTVLLSSTRLIQLFRLIPLSAAERATR